MAGEKHIQTHGGLAELLLRYRFSQGQELLRDFAAYHHKHHQHLPALGRDQFDVLVARLFGTRRGDHRHTLRLMGQDGRRQLHPLLNIGPGLVELMRDRVLHRFRQFGLVHHLTHEIAVALLGGDAARRGMRLAQVAHVGQGAHLVADGGGGKIEMIVFDEPL
jgi:hypothetical protein